MNVIGAIGKLFIEHPYIMIPAFCVWAIGTKASLLTDNSMRSYIKSLLF